MGRVQQLKREGKPLPPEAAVDEQGNATTDPNAVNALLPFGRHKGYGLSLINELLAAYTGGSLPTLRSRRGRGPDGEKHTPAFFFQCMKPDALDCGDFAQGRAQDENVRMVIEDILGHGNEGCLLPGQVEAEAAQLTDKYGGLLFTRAEIEAYAGIAEEVGVDFAADALATADLD